MMGALLLCHLSPHAQQSNEIVLWKVGSPHTGSVPHTLRPQDLVRAADSIGVKLRIEAFPAKGFAAKFRDAVRAGKPPDLVGVDNFGILTGISTPLGDFDGIADTRESASDLIQIAGSLDSVLVPARGW